MADDDGDADVCENPQSSAFLIGARALLSELLLIEVPSIKVRDRAARAVLDPSCERRSSSSHEHSRRLADLPVYPIRHLRASGTHGRSMETSVRVSPWAC